MIVLVSVYLCVGVVAGLILRSFKGHIGYLGKYAATSFAMSPFLLYFSTYFIHIIFRSFHFASGGYPERARWSNDRIAFALFV